MDHVGARGRNLVPGSTSPLASLHPLHHILMVPPPEPRQKATVNARAGCGRHRVSDVRSDGRHGRGAGLDQREHRAGSNPDRARRELDVCKRTEDHPWKGGQALTEQIKFLPPRGATERERDFAINRLVKRVNEGAIVEQGSNANGEYIRWAGGWQLCTHIVDDTGADWTTELSGTGLFRRSSFYRWNFPAAFSHPPTSTVTADVNANATAAAGLTAAIAFAHLSRVDVQVQSPVSRPSGGNQKGFHLRSVGRWF